MVLSSLLCTRDKYLRLSKLTVQNFTHIFIDQKPKSYRSKNTMNVDKSYEVEPLLKIWRYKEIPYEPIRSTDAKKR